MYQRLGYSCLAALSLAFFAAESRAGNLEPAGINLGATSFYDGFGRNGGGFVYLVYGQYSTASSFKDGRGNTEPIFNNPKFDVYALINQLAYVVPEPLFGDAAHFGFNFIVPFVGFDTHFDPPPPPPGIQLKDAGVGFGDITFGPLLQFRPIKLGEHTMFSHRVELDLIAPTGKYDPTKDINQSSNFLSFNPYWALTLLPYDGFELSVRLHYLYNFANTRPTGLPPPAASVSTAKAGQAFWVNFAASYEVIHTLHIGANGYYFRQFTDDEYRAIDGTAVAPETAGDPGKATIFGIGPGVFYEPGKQDKLYANFYFEPVVEARPQSMLLNLHYIHSF